MGVTIVVMSFVLGLLIGLAFFAMCKNRLDLEKRMHQMTKDAFTRASNKLNEKL